MEQMNQAYKVFTRICLNNWHYIDRKVLGLNESINFFTGHSGSGKSTVIDAMQIVLYANTDGRGFFNKAAADDSDRSLIEYLRGMINIGEDNRFSYLRNQNFSSTIALARIIRRNISGTKTFPRRSFLRWNRRPRRKKNASGLCLTWRQRPTRSIVYFSGTREN